jgi:hypothetical protein
MILLATLSVIKVSLIFNSQFVDLEMFLDDGIDGDDGDMYPQTDMNNEDAFNTDGDQAQRGAVAR